MEPLVPSPRVLGERADGLGCFAAMHLRDIGEWPERLNLRSPHFALLLALDVRGIAADALIGFARRAVDAGLAYLVAWGPDCERVHDVFDECYVERKVFHRPPPPGPVMTTGHAEESLADAAEFFALCAIPDAREWECRTWLAVTVGDARWADEVARTLSAPPYAMPT